jgi:hypothetical protein
MFEPTPVDWSKGVDRAILTLDENWERLREYDQKAKAEGRLVGRYIREHIADGFAVYEIIRENKTTVRIRRIEHICGDEWSIPYWGEEATIDKVYALQRINGRDAWEDMINGRE